MKKKANKSVTSGFFVIFIMLAILALFYFIINGKKEPETEKEVSQIQEVLLRSMELDYPPSPKEVVKYYSEITKALYTDGGITEEELNDLGLRAMELYDSELVESMEEESYFQDLKAEVEDMNSKGYSVSSYSTSASTDVEYFTQDGYECAGLYCIYTMRAGTTYFTTREVFILRKDAEGHWKIYGWEIVTSDDEDGK